MQVTFTHKILDILWVTVASPGSPAVFQCPSFISDHQLGTIGAGLMTACAAVLPEGENLPGWKDVHTS